MRLVVNWIATILLTILASTIGLVGLLVSPGGWIGRRASTLWARGVLFSGGVKVSSKGVENVPDEPCVIVANHASMLDICVCQAVLPIDFVFVSRPFFFLVPFLGWGMLFTRHIALDPRRPRKAARVLRNLDVRLRRGVSVLLFPEGTRSPDGRVGRYRRGPFLTAIRAGVPILPVRLEGLFERLPRGKLAVRPGEAAVTVGEPIPTKKLSPPDARELAQEVENWTRERSADSGQP